MHRFSLNYLENNWIINADRKPLVIRGARQVGKTWIVKELAKRTGKQLIEINFEREPRLRSLFEPNDPKIIIQNLETYRGYKEGKIIPASSILFLDEIQSAPEILAKLRWFYEELPDLPVISAGSLLEFILNDYSYSMPVGRITHMYLEPLSFEEFLTAGGAEQLIIYTQQLLPRSFHEIPIAIHHKIQDHFRNYIQIGGMPDSVSKWVNEGATASMIIQEDLIATYRSDFFKYKGRIDAQKLDILLRSVPAQLGEKFVYSKTDTSMKSAMAKQILSLLNKAGLCHSVQHSSGSSSSLAAETKNKSFKQIFLDVGLANRLLGNSSYPLIKGIAEQVVGQMLRCLFPLYVEPALYYWNREERGSSAEIDYLIEHNGIIIPIEVKSGSTGSLKSLHLFMHIKKLSLAVRINDDLPSVTKVKTLLNNGTEVSYTLLSIPFYLTGQIHRLLDDMN